jgi:hypothetical protein
MCSSRTHAHTRARTDAQAHNIWAGFVLFIVQETAKIDSFHVPEQIVLAVNFHIRVKSPMKAGVVAPNDRTYRQVTKYV